jgi:cytosine/adenosine deaminase-related metal-dependent hydrolase
VSSTAKGPAVRGADERAFPQTPTRESQRFLLGLMNALISEFAEREGLDPASAATFLGDIGIRDSVPEFNEVLEKYAADPEKPLNDHLRATAESSQEKAHWSRHWSSG